jgi:hypothetical protein
MFSLFEKSVGGLPGASGLGLGALISTIKIKACQLPQLCFL